MQIAGGCSKPAAGKTNMISGLIIAPQVGGQLHFV